MQRWWSRASPQQTLCVKPSMLPCLPNRSPAQIRPGRVGSGRVEEGLGEQEKPRSERCTLLSRPRTCLVFMFRFWQLIHSKWIRAGSRIEACSCHLRAASPRVVSCSTFDLTSYSRCFYASGFAYSVPPSICFHPAEFASWRRSLAAVVSPVGATVACSHKDRRSCAIGLSSVLFCSFLSSVISWFSF